MLIKYNRIKDVLREQGRSQVWLARQINRTPAAMNSICQNRSQPSILLLNKIATLLKVSPKDLIGDGSVIED